MDSPLLYWLFGSIASDKTTRKHLKHIYSSIIDEESLHSETEVLKNDLTDLKSAISSCKKTRISAEKKF